MLKKATVTKCPNNVGILQMCVFFCMQFVTSLLGMPKNENAQESERCWNMRMCAFLCVLLVSLLLGKPKNAIGPKVQTMLE